MVLGSVYKDLNNGMVLVLKILILPVLITKHLADPSDLNATMELHKSQNSPAMG